MKNLSLNIIGGFVVLAVITLGGWVSYSEIKINEKLSKLEEENKLLTNQIENLNERFESKVSLVRGTEGKRGLPGPKGEPGKDGLVVSCKECSNTENVRNRSNSIAVVDISNKTDQEVLVGDYIVKLNFCKKSGPRKTICEFKIVNTSKAHRVIMHGSHKNRTRMIMDSGDIIVASEVYIGNVGGTHRHYPIVLPEDTPVKGKVVFYDVKDDKVAVLELGFAKKFLTSNVPRAKFKNITIN